MTTNLLPFISFVLIATFTPGPSNISSASLSILHGYKSTLKYQAGLAVAVFLFMLVTAWLSTILLRLFPAFEPLMRILGAGYILYLALGILKASYTFLEKDTKPLGFVHGFVLQILNPKLFIYAFTLFSTFLAPLTRDTISSLWIIALLAAVSFCATSVWALFGTVIKSYLRNPRLRMIINVILSLSLVYTAISLTGVI
jgi:cysteine/O-acetylserine efflux protein